MLEYGNNQPGHQEIPAQVFFGLPQVYVPKGAHVAHFFREEQERVDLLGSYVQAGLQAGDLCTVITGLNASTSIEERLAGLGVDVAAVLDSGQLYIARGSQDALDLSDLFESLSSRAKSEGRDTVRVGEDMSWTLSKLPNAETLMELEALYQRHFAHRGDFVALCQYDYSRFSGSTIMNAFRTHPLSIIGNIVQENPFARNPEEILSELSQATFDSPL